MPANNWTVKVIDAEMHEDMFVKMQKNEAAKLAKEEAARVGPNGRVFVSRYRKTDGSTEYLAPNGDASPVGESWT